MVGVSAAKVKNELVRMKKLNAKDILSDKCVQDKVTGSSFINTAIINQMLRLPEGEFWGIVSNRLNVPLAKTDQKQFGGENREYWSWNYLVEEIFLQVAPIKSLVTHNGKQISIYKYYNQALRLKKWIPIAKAPVEFVINISDVTVRILAELKVLGPEESQQVLKLAVAKIFENIAGSRYTHRSILRNLKVRLDK
jgi:hypothetical protein